MRNGDYCFKKQVKTQIEYRPLEPQPKKVQIVVLHRYCTTHKLDETYKNDHLVRGGDYVKRPDYIMDDIYKMTGHKPADISYLTLKDK